MFLRKIIYIFRNLSPWHSQLLVLVSVRDVYSKVAVLFSIQYIFKLWTIATLFTYVSRPYMYIGITFARGAASVNSWQHLVKKYILI